MRESWSLEQCAGTKQQWVVLREHGAFSSSLHFLLQRLTCEVFCYESEFLMFHCVWDPLEKANMNGAHRHLPISSLTYMYFKVSRLHLVNSFCHSKWQIIYAFFEITLGKWFMQYICWLVSHGKLHITYAFVYDEH